MLEHVSAFRSFLRLYSIPLYEQATWCVSIHLLVDMWVVSTYRLM